MAEQTITSEIIPAFGIAKGKTATESELLELVMEAWKDGIERRRPFEKDWMHNIMFAAGHQWLEWDVMDGQWRLRDRVPKERVRMVENRTRRLHEAAIALLVGHRPRWNVITGSRDQKDRVKAQISQRALDAAWDTYSLDELTEEAVDWQLSTGIVAVKTFWDTDMGGMVEVTKRDKKGREIVDERGNPIVTLEPAGDVHDVVIPPFLILPDPTATKPADLGWLIHHPWRQKAYIEQRWPKKAEEVQFEGRPEDDWTEAKLKDYYSSRGVQYQEPPEGKRFCKGAYIAEMIIRPGRKYPKGAMIHVAMTGKEGSGIFLDWVDELDEDIQQQGFLPGHTGLGIEFARCFAVPGRFWPMSFLDLLCPMNKHLNKVLSDVLEIEDKHAKPKWLVARNAQLAEGALHQGAGEVVEYNWPFKPEQSQPTQMPVYVVDLHKTIPVRMQELAGVHQATLGQTPGDLRSGIAISLVQEQDERGFTRPNREKERLLSRMGRRRLALMRDNYEEDRLVHLAGDETAPWDMQEFRKTDFTGLQDVRVKEGSTLRRNVAAQRSHILELLQTGAGPALTDLPPIERGTALARILEALDLGDIGTLYDATSLDSQNARYEQAMMERGQPMPITPEENPLVHLRVHGDDIKSAASQAGNPAILAIKRQHFMQTRQLALTMIVGTGGGETETPTGGSGTKAKPPGGPQRTPREPKEERPGPQAQQP
ncbi:MAG TPA: hypothetical protein VM695_09965 [Phycisphaerae bacterium]|nr:hypothetical protein [Phycisphaerae bacterium]